jgi:hypothetical protein
MLVAVPPFLCMPPWGDVTLYDVAARNVLRGGVHYRDVFDTNLPGMVWAMAAIRATCGWSSEALRVWDLAVVGWAVVLLAGWVRKGGPPAAAGAWFVAAAALFYLFTSEFSHCQRDPWMLLPAALAARLRLRQVHRGPNGNRRLLGPAVLEGFVWGLAVWMKPHVLIPAAGVWLVSAVVLARIHDLGSIAIDFLGLLIGGILAGLPGVLWLVGTGAWPEFVDVFTRWNPEYTARTWGELPERVGSAFAYFFPWGNVHFAAIPVALWYLWRVRSSEPGAAARGLLGAFYMAWLGQAVVLQRGLDYARVPDTFLALAVLSTGRWAGGYVLLVVVLTIGGLRGANPDVLQLWPRCWREGSTPELRDRLGYYTDIHCGTTWTDLDGVTRFLRTVDPPLRDRELNCWHDSTHPLYLMLDLKPATRYMHYGTVFPIRSQADRIRREVAGCPQRYVVSDLRRMTYVKVEAYAPGAGGPNSLPAWFPRSQRDLFPWNQPIVFRSGRYLVHRVSRPPRPEEIDIPEWNDLDQLGPGVGTQ